MTVRIAFASAVVLLLGLFLVRAFGEPFDTGLINIATLILGFFAWLSLVIGFAFSESPRFVWRTLTIFPMLLIAGWLAMYRVVRVDGNLIPQFESRWKQPPALPTQATEEAAAVAANLIEPRGTDFVQFLGKQRNGTVSDVSLETDWNAHPPEIVWKQPIGGGWSAFAIQGDLAVTLEQRDDEQWISAYEVPTGKLLWHTPLPGTHFNPLGGAGPRSTPTISDNKVYAHMVNGLAVCVDLASGKKLWEVDLLKMVNWNQSDAESQVSWGRSGSPLIVDNEAVFPLGGPRAEDGTLVALDKNSGDVIWKSGLGQISYSSPMIISLLGVRQIVIVNESSIAAHEPDSGQQLWQIDWAGQSNGPANVSQTIQVDDRRLLVTKGYGQGSQLVEFSKDADGKFNSKVVWRESAVLKTKFTSAVLLDKHAYGLSDGVLECVEVNTGNRAWKKGRYQQGQLLLVGDVLLIVSEAGEVVLVKADPTGHKELAKLKVLEGVTWNTPALSGDRLLIRNSDEAACIRLPLAK